MWRGHEGWCVKNKCDSSPAIDLHKIGSMPTLSLFLLSALFYQIARYSTSNISRKSTLTNNHVTTHPAPNAGSPPPSRHPPPLPNNSRLHRLHRIPPPNPDIPNTPLHPPLSPGAPRPLNPASATHQHLRRSDQSDKASKRLYSRRAVLAHRSTLVCEPFCGVSTVLYR